VREGGFVTVLWTSARNAGGREVLELKAVQALHRSFEIHVVVVLQQGTMARGVQRPGSTDENVLFGIQDPFQIHTRNPYSREADEVGMQ
jgi:hypothetical protein